DDADRARREIQIVGDSRRFALRVVREQQDQPFPLGEAPQARRNTRTIERPQRRRRRLDGRIDESRRQRLPPPRDPSFRLAQHPAGPQDERSNLLEFLHVASAQALDREQQNILREIVSDRIAPQVTAAVEPYPRREAAIELRLLYIGASRGAADDSACE